MSDPRMASKSMEELLISEVKEERVLGRILAALAEPMSKLMKAELERSDPHIVVKQMTHYIATEIGYMVFKLGLSGAEGEALTAVLKQLTQTSYEVLMYYIETTNKQDNNTSIILQ